MKMKHLPLCHYDESHDSCYNCPYPDCLNDEIMDDDFIEEPPPEKDNTDSLYEDRFGEKKGKRKYTRYKNTYFDDERHKKAREYSRRKRYGIPQEPRVFKQKGREREYQREYRAQMPPEQRERYLAKQREYNRKRRAKAREDQSA